MKAGVLNWGPNSWVFRDFAKHLSETVGLEVVNSPVDYNYLLSWGDKVPDEAKTGRLNLFIPSDGILIASDKRKQAGVFYEKGIPTPKTYLCGREEVNGILDSEKRKEFCVKWPTGTGAYGHRMVKGLEDIKEDWPTPIILQEFIRLDTPRVYRMYGAGGKLFGWNKRELDSLWVSHERGAKYVQLDNPEEKVYDICRKTLEAVGLYDSFGCVDLLQDWKGSWLVLEVGTDGVFNYVDRNLDIPELEREIDNSVMEAFWEKGKRLKP